MFLNETQMYVPQLALFTNGLPETAASPIEPCPKESLPIPFAMLELFEQMTGWVVEFAETSASFRRRQLPTLTPQRATGTFSIVDMSAEWPASRPTSHRAKCDRFIQFLDSLVNELQVIQSQLSKAQSTIAAFSPPAIEDEDAILVDSFIPRYDTDYRDDCDDFVVDQVCKFTELGAVCDAFGNPSRRDAAAPANFPLSGWLIGGAPGFFDGNYVDWRLNEGGKIELILGQLEANDRSEGVESFDPSSYRGTDGHCDSDRSEQETILLIDPRTNEFRFSGTMLRGFWLLDGQQNKLVPLEQLPEHRHLNSSQAIVVTSASLFLAEEDSSEFGNFQGPEQLAIAVRKLVGPDDPVLVLQRC